MDSGIIFCAKDLFLLTIILAAFGWFRLNQANKIKLFAQLALAGVAAYALAKLASKLYYDPRPFVSRNIQPLITHAPDNGFPSDHAWFTATIAAVLWQYSKKLGYLAAGTALLVGIARVLADVHSPIDIAAGFIIGMAAAYIGGWLMNQLPWIKKQRRAN